MADIHGLYMGGDPNHLRSRDDPPSATPQKKCEGEVHHIFLLDKNLLV